MKIIWSPLSVERLEDIYDFISDDNLNSAKKFINKIFKKVESLVEYPHRGRKVPEANREVFLGEYRIIYRIEKRMITVLTIRNFKQILPEEDIK